MVNSNDVINVFVRKNTGTSECKKIRKFDKIPSIIYSKDFSTPVYIGKDNIKSLINKIDSGNNVVSLNFNNSIINTIIKDVHRHPYKPNILHIDFQRVNFDDYIVIKVPFIFVGGEVSPGIKSGGVMLKQMISVNIKCKFCDIPKGINVDISKLTLNSSLYLSNIKLSDKLKFALLTKTKNKQRYLVISITPSKVYKSVDENKT